MKQYLVLSALAIQLLSSCGSNSKENGLALGEKKAALEKLKSQKTFIKYSSSNYLIIVAFMLN